MQKIAKVGVEIEGGWLVNSKESDLYRLIYDDGSVNLDNHYDKGDHDCDCDDEDCCYRDGGEFTEPTNVHGEICSDPYTNKEDLFKWMDVYYPKNANSTCGLHIHISFKSRDLYALIMHRRYIRLFRESFKAWGELNCEDRTLDENKRFWERYSGNNSFCLVNQDTHALDHLRGRRGAGRYYQLNYQAWHKFQTLECRLLPTFNNKQKAIRAVNNFLELTENYLNSAEANEHTAKYLSAIS